MIELIAQNEEKNHKLGLGVAERRNQLGNAISKKSPGSKIFYIQISNSKFENFWKTPYKFFF